MAIRYKYEGDGFSQWLNRDLPYSNDFLVGLYRDMLRIRLIEEEIEGRYHQDQMKTPIHLVIGQEATAVGSAAALALEDLLYASHRTHGNYLAKGGDLKAMLCEMHCRINGCVGSRGGSMHLMDKSVGMAGSSAIVAGVVPIATGAALAAQMRGDSHVVMVFLGDAATEEGAVSEALNFAALKQLPVVFFCENNFYSVQSPLHTRQPVREIHKWAATYGMPSRLIDGTNVLDVYEASLEAVSRAKRGEGPSFIEAEVYRFRAHGGSGDDSLTGYRDVAEVEAWQEVCPLDTYYRYLEHKGLMDDGKNEAMRGEIIKEIAEAFEFALASPNPEEKDLYTHVYAD